MKSLRIVCECGCQFAFEGESTPEKGYKCFMCGGPIKNKDAILDADGNEIVSNETYIETTKSTKNEKIEKQNEKKKVRKEKKLLKKNKVKKERIK